MHETDMPRGSFRLRSAASLSMHPQRRLSAHYLPAFSSWTQPIKAQNKMSRRSGPYSSRALDRSASLASPPGARPISDSPAPGSQGRDQVKLHAVSPSGRAENHRENFITRTKKRYLRLRRKLHSAERPSKEITETSGTV